MFRFILVSCIVLFEIAFAKAQDNCIDGKCYLNNKSVSQVVFEMPAQQHEVKTIIPVNNIIYQNSNERRFAPIRNLRSFFFNVRIKASMLRRF